VGAAVFDSKPVVEFLNGEKQRAIFPDRVLDTAGVDLVLISFGHVRSDVNVLRPKVVACN
jgi:hypothetical protein